MENKKKYAIITSCDEKYGDFLVNHWLKSLEENVNLKNIDIIVLNYGLNPKQISMLKHVKVLNCEKDGHIVIIRYKDMEKFFIKNKYDQILSIDGGDVIFQKDFINLFEENINDFRVVCEHSNFFPFKDILLNNYFNKNIVQDIKKTLKNKKMINAGVIFAPYQKFMDLCKECNNLIVDKSQFGLDQVIVNYVLYRDGFKILDEKYNFVVNTSKEKFFMKDYKFYLINKEIIPIVHNAGNKNIFRPIKKFGYGYGYNKVRFLTYHGIRNFTRLVEYFRM